MKIFKFGGASVKDADGVKNVATILKNYPGAQIGIVVSAMGKTTNHLEILLQKYLDGEDSTTTLKEIEDYHLKISEDLFEERHSIFELLGENFRKIKDRLLDSPSENFDFEYDQLVSFGEVFSSLIVSQYLHEHGIPNHWLDARELIRTDHNYREARIDWEKTTILLNDRITSLKGAKPNYKVFITQGFIGHTKEKNVTTLGREGSDFSAAILAHVLNAESVVIWKDVPGMLNADPRYFKDTVKLKQISYKEAIELSYFGASVIHPKTIKPLQNKEIPLYVKSFMEPNEEGTLIHSSTFSDYLTASYIFKKNQILISISPRDFSFIDEDNLSLIFKVFAQNKITINLMQNSAINFSVCVDNVVDRINKIIEDLSPAFEIRFNRGCELVTIRHYDQTTLSRLLIGKKILIEQRSRTTARLVLSEMD